MTEGELTDALIGIYAYDTGGTDSGIKNEDLRAKCLQALRDAPRRPGELVAQRIIGRMVRELFLTEEALEQGYGIEDAVKFAHWLDDQLDWSVL